MSDLDTSAAAAKLVLDRLDGLLTRLRSLRAPIVDQLRPGLSEPEVDALCSAHGLVLPSEARALWLWHNGAGVSQGEMPGAQLGPGIYFYSLEEGIAESGRFRQLVEATTTNDEDRDDAWDRHWLAMARAHNARRFALDCGQPDGAVAPVIIVDPRMEDVSRPGPASLADLVGAWCQAIDNSVWTYDRDTATWNRDVAGLTVQQEAYL